MSLKLTKPLAFIDLETTGLNVGKDRIVEIAILKLNPDNSKETMVMKVNPEMPIPPESTLIHGITDSDVKDEQPFSKVAKSLANFIGNADLSGYNIFKFDLPLIVEEFMRVNVDFSLEGRKIIDVQHIFHKKEKRDLASAYQFYCKKDIEHQHSAEYDIRATEEILHEQINRYQDIGEDIDALYDFTGRQLEQVVDLASRIIKDEKGNILFNFGKHKGKTVEEVFQKDSNYYSWMMQSDFPQYTKKKLTELYIKWKQRK